jgi:hypothetical protein
MAPEMFEPSDVALAAVQSTGDPARRGRLLSGLGPRTGELRTLNTRVTRSRWGCAPVEPQLASMCCPLAREGTRWRTSSM